MTARPTPTPIPAAAPGERPLDFEELADGEGGVDEAEEGEDDAVEDGELEPDDDDPPLWPLAMSASTLSSGQDKY